MQESPENPAPLIEDAEERQPNQATSQKFKIRKAITSGALLSTPFLLMNSLATIVAAYGLFANSPAVVIGAMIIAMLLGPIMGLALALVDGDTDLLKKALLSEFIGAVMVVGIAFIIGTIHRDFPLTPEILSRTQPNLIDLMIALAGGAAGAYATVSPRVSAGLVGVAISTALVPPLTTTGICLARGLNDLALGGFILFATNLVAIQCASSAVLFFHGFHEITHRDPEDRSYRWRLVLDVTLLLGLAIFLTTQLTKALEKRTFEENVRVELQRGLSVLPGAYLSDARFLEDGANDVIVAVVSVPYSINPDQVAKLEAGITPKEGRTIKLHVRSIITKEVTREGYLHEIEPEAPRIDTVEQLPVPLPSETPEVSRPEDNPPESLSSTGGTGDDAKPDPEPEVSPKPTDLQAEGSG